MLPQAVLYTCVLGILHQLDLKSKADKNSSQVRQSHFLSCNLEGALEITSRVYRKDPNPRVERKLRDAVVSGVMNGKCKYDLEHFALKKKNHY